MDVNPITVAFRFVSPELVSEHGNGIYFSFIFSHLTTAISTPTPQQLRSFVRHKLASVILLRN